MIGKILLAGAVITAAKGLDNRLEVTRYNLKYKNLPKEFDKFKIVHIADFHCDTTAGLADAIKSENPDIICATGDMVHDTGGCEPFWNLLRELTKISPVYIISGNHDIWRSDYDDFVLKTKEFGGIFLQNERVFIEKKGEKISIAGIEDPSSISNVVIEERINNSIDKIGKFDGFDILMFHRANMLDKFKNLGYDLILAGHMHGGQMRVPGLGGLVSPKTNFYSKQRVILPKYFGGEYTFNNTKMIVTRGIGNPTILPRLFNRPEICSITLLKDEN